MKKKICYTKEQEQVMQHDTGVALVVGGGGTGKTKTLHGTIATLLKKDIKAHQILVLNYGPWASKTFNARLRYELGPAADVVCVTTIHGFGLDIIRKHYEKLGLIVPPKWSNVIRNNKLPAQVKRKRNIFDYDDLITMTLQLFKKYPTILDTVANHYTDLMVDDLQDVDEKQAMLIELLASKMNSVLLAGDPKQALFGYKNSGVKHWKRLIKNLAPIQFTLTQTQRIPNASVPFVNSFAASFSDDPHLISKDVAGHKPELHRFDDPDAQVNFIAIEVKKLLKAGVHPSQIVCIGRYNNSLLHLRVALKTRGIMTVQSDYSKVLDKWSKALGALIGIVKWIINQQLPIPKKCIKYVMEVVGIPIKERDTILNNIVENGIGVLMMPKPKQKPKSEPKTKKKSDTPYRRFNNLRNAIIAASQQTDVQAGVQILISALMPYISKSNKEYKNRIQCDLSVVKIRVRDQTWRKIKKEVVIFNDHKTGVTLTTIHGAKGREWEHVFVINVVKGEFPSSKGKVVDEQKMMYTAFTRHTEQLYLLQTVVRTTIFIKGNKQVHQVFYKESSLLTPHVKHLKICRKKIM